MFFEVLSLTYHIPITIESLTYRVLRGTSWYWSQSAGVNSSWRAVAALDDFRNWLIREAA